MFASSAPLLAGPRIGNLFHRRSNVPRVERDLQALLTRMRQRLYPETMPALASFWLKTVHASGYSRRRWKELDHLLQLVLDEPPLDDFSREVLIEIKSWIQEMVLRGHTPESVPPRLEPVRARLNSEGVIAYIVRLLNEWLPVEVARLLIDEIESTAQQDGGVPVLTIGTAIERLVVREHLSRSTLEVLLEPELLSPECVYPADLEMLRDVVLSQLGRTEAPVPSVMPATLLCVAPDSHLPIDYREALRYASVVRQPNGEEVRVPIEPARAREIMKDERVRIGSIIVTMDGRCWGAENLQCGEQHSVVYRAVGRLRIVYAGGHATLRVPWPENRLRWSGGNYFGGTLKIFGREWHVSKWEVDAERTWLHLAFSRALPICEIDPRADRASWRLRPASVDMAWAALESALTSAVVRKSSDPIEQMRHRDLIPLGRGILGLAESVMKGRPQTYEAIETRLRALRYLESLVELDYGRVPWRILPRPVRAAFLRVRRSPVLLGLLNEVIEGLPETFRQPLDQRVSFDKDPGDKGPRSPKSPRAA